jgi:hypothetical protein
MWPTRRQWQGWSLPSKLTFLGAWAGFISLALVFILPIIHQVAQWRADPKPEAPVAVADAEIYVKIRACHPMSSLTIDFPVLGRIVNVHDYNAAPDAIIVSETIVGRNEPNSQNNVEIVVSDIKRIETCRLRSYSSLHRRRCTWRVRIDGKCHIRGSMMAQ